jgi:hypothetical protein
MNIVNQNLTACLTLLHPSREKGDGTKALPIRHILDLCVQSSHYVRYSHPTFGEAGRWTTISSGGKS